MSRYLRRLVLAAAIVGVAVTVRAAPGGGFGGRRFGHHDRFFFDFDFGFPAYYYTPYYYPYGYYDYYPPPV